jgi:hypothetical protein
MKISPILISQLIVFSGFSQGIVSNACSSAPIICNNINSYPLSVGVSANPSIPAYGGISNPSTNPNVGNAGCLASGELNPNWFRIVIETGGLLELKFGALNLGGGTSGFFDWILYPYSSTACDQLAGDSLVPIACNMNAAPIGITGIVSTGNIPLGANPGNFESPITVNAGDEFILCISNASFQNGNLYFESIGTATICSATASIDPIANQSELELFTFENYIRVGGLNEAFSVQIVDLQGRVAVEAQGLTSDSPISTAELIPALYLIQVETEAGIQTIRYFKS